MYLICFIMWTKRKKPFVLRLASFSCTIANAYYPIFSKAVPSALLMSLEWELWPFQQFCDLFGTFVTFLWPFYDLFSNFMTFLWPLWPFYDLFSTFVTLLWMTKKVTILWTTKWYYLDLIVTFLWPFQHFYDLFVNDKMILSRSNCDLFMPFSALLWPFCERQKGSQFYE